MTVLVWVLVKNFANIHAQVIALDHVVVQVWEVPTAAVLVAQVLVAPVAKIVVEAAKILVQVVVSNLVKEVVRKRVALLVKRPVRRHVREHAAHLVRVIATKVVKVHVTRDVLALAILDAKGVVNLGVVHALAHAFLRAGELVWELVPGQCLFTNPTHL